MVHTCMEFLKRGDLPLKRKMKRARIKLALPLAAVLLLPSTAFAATNLPQSDAHLPEKVQENALESSLPTVGGGSAAAAFRLSRIDVEQDGTQLNADELSRKAARYTERTISTAELNTLLGDLTAYARSHGYPAAAAYLPPQTNAEGALTIRILAGRYGKITIDSSAAIDDGQIRRLAHALHTGAPIEGRRLEKALYNIAALGGIEAAGLLSPGADFGTSDLTIRVRDGKRQSFVLYSENYGSKTSGRYRYGAQASLSNITRSGDRLSLAAMLSNEDLRNYSVTYTRPVGVDGTVLGLGVSRMDYELSGAFRRLGAQGHADTVSLFGTSPLLRTARDSVSLTYGWDWRKLEDEYKNVGMTLEKHSNAAHIGVRGEMNRPRTRLTYDLTAYHGTIASDSAMAERQMRRAGTEGSFTKGVLNLGVRQELGGRFHLNLKTQLQAAGDNLDSSEEIYLGGANGVRAYPQGEGSGDSGYLASAELVYRTGIPHLDLSTYYDTGHVVYAHDGVDGGTTLSGWGIGVSYSRPGDYFLRLDWARRIGLARNASEEAKAKNRLCFMVGKVW